MKRALTIFALALALSGCGTTGTFTLPAAPAWQGPSDATTFTGLQVAVRTYALLPGVAVSYSDASYSLVSHEWLERYIDWTWHAARALGLRYTPQTFDCEDFALAFHLVAVKKGAQAGLKHPPLIARLVVQMPEGRHELIGVATDRGLFVVEPQPHAGPFRIWPLANYPHRILSVVLGDFNPL